MTLMALRTVTCMKKPSRFCTTFIHRSMSITTSTFPLHRNNAEINSIEFTQTKLHYLTSSLSSLKSFQSKFKHGQCLYQSTTSSSNYSNEETIDEEVTHVLRFDGAVSKSPPYKAGAGILLYDASSGEEILSTSYYFGSNKLTLVSNKKKSEFSSLGVQNTPEFQMYISAIVAQGKSLLLGMQYAKDMGVKNLIVQGHSPLIHFYNENSQNDDNEQQQQPKNKDVQIIYKKIQDEINVLNFDSFQMFMIEKENNKEALDLAQHAIYISKGIDDENNIYQEESLETESSLLSFNDDSKDNFDNEILDKKVSEQTMETENEKNAISPRISAITEINHLNQETNSKIDTEKTYLLQFDGGSRGNPGIAGAGYTIYDTSPLSSSSHTDKKEVESGSYFVGFSSTNNEAEYTALIKGLECCQKLGIKHIIAQGDSALVVNQVNKAWKCKKQNLQKLLQNVNDIIKTKGQDSKELNNFQSFQIQHIPRELNGRADELANEAMNKQK